MIIEIQCLPSPSGTADDAHAHVEAAIAVIAGAGLHHEVGALGTTIEGEPDELWPLLRQVHEACLAAGADRAVSVIKVAEGRDGTATMDDLTAKFR
ncbi:MTH1187 family thiamine-binding protein [soil metagenome]